MDTYEPCRHICQLVEKVLMKNKRIMVKEIDRLCGRELFRLQLSQSFLEL